MVVLLATVVACKPSTPSKSAGGPMGSAGSSQSGDIGQPIQVGSQVKKVGSSNIDFILGLSFTTPFETTDIVDTAKGAFTIQNADTRGVPVFNKFFISGDGKLEQVTKVVAKKCSTNIYRTGTVAIAGDMTGNFDRSKKDACKLNLKIKITYNQTVAPMTNCPVAGVPIEMDNYDFDLSLPAINNYNAPFNSPGTEWQINNVKLTKLVIDQSLTGCKVTEQK
jgi:hypothetical protein